MSCEWPVERGCLPPLPDLPDTPTQQEQAAYDAALAQRNAAEDLAVAVLHALSGRQFGVCETVVRPCDPGFGYGPWPAYVWTRDAGHWSSWPCGCIGSCTISGPRAVHLPGPVAAVTEVRLAGVVLAPTGYQLEGDTLYRLCDFGSVWPTQNLGAPLGEPGTWSVTYGRGYPVPPGVDRLTGQLAGEFINACSGDGKKCKLPRTVVSTTQRGATHVFEPSKMLAAGKTGLPDIDMWLAAVNPNHLHSAPEVL